MSFLFICLSQPFKAVKSCTPQAAQAPQGMRCATESGQHGSTAWADGNVGSSKKAARKWLQAEPDL